MEKIVYFEKLFTKRREKLIDLCEMLHKEGKRYIYILPSREAIKDVRYSLFERTGGIFNSHIIMFDELDELITDNKYKTREVGDVFCIELLKQICSRKKDELKYYNKIYNKHGFLRETLAFIKKLKRNCIYEESLLNIIEKEDNRIFKLKLQDMSTLYKAFNKEMNKFNLYKIEDISLKALEQVANKNILDEIDTIIIDGFVNYDKVYMELLKKISSNKACNIYINASFKNYLTEGFIKNEIVQELINVGFELKEENIEEYTINNEIKEISRKLYSGSRLPHKPSSIEICKYPCVESEVRETARSIKRNMIQGENLNNIAVFVNSRELYIPYITKIFKEFNLPCEATYELPLKKSENVRRILCSIEENEEEMNGQQWLNYIEEELENYHKAVKETWIKALKEDLNYSDKIYIKSYEAVRRIVKELNYTFQQSGILNEPLNNKYVLNTVLGFVDSSTITIHRKGNGGVKILNTDLAKGNFYEHIYVLGLNEGQVPKSNNINGLFNDHEIKKLNEIGINYGNYTWELNREKIRFNLTTASAVKKINLSYRGADENGSYLIPSSFIEEIKFMSNISRENIKEITMRDRFNISNKDIMSSHELKSMQLKNIFERYYKGFYAADIEERIEVIERYDKRIKELVYRGNIEYNREMGKDFNKYEAVLNTSPYEMNTEYFKPSQIVSYLSCPFKYYIQNMLNTFSMEEDDKAFNALEIGNLYHGTLEQYFKGFYLNINDEKVIMNYNSEKAEIVFNDQFKTMRKLNNSNEDDENLKEELKNTILKFIELEVKRLKNYYDKTNRILFPYMIERKIRNEESFGVPISCVVDRVDLEYEINGSEITPTGKFAVYDYKKNRIKSIDDILEGRECQLSIYYHIVKNEIEKELGIHNAECMALLYMSVEETAGSKNLAKKNPGVIVDGLYKREYKKSLGISKRSEVNEKVFSEIIEYVRKTTLEAAEDIKNGKFNYCLSCSDFDDTVYNYYSCDLKHVCRYSRMKVISNKGVL